MSLAPSRLEPRFLPRIWGAHSLEPLFPEKASLQEPVGEVWLTGDDCTFTSGEFAGQRLGAAWPRMPAPWRGTQLAGGDGPFPLLAKFLFPEDKLSVQVHPDDDYARRRHGPGFRGKTEMWYAISARPGAQVMVGLRPEVTREAFARAIAAGAAEECLLPLPLSPGDAVFVPAGAAHTIGPGLRLCEIQENSDLTYRLYDYNRLTAEGAPRALHVRDGLEATRFGPQAGGRTRPVTVQSGALRETYLAACRYFAVEKWEFTAAVDVTSVPERFDLLIFFAGAGSFEFARASSAYRRGEAWLVPAALGPYRLQPAAPTALLRAYVPGAEPGFARPVGESARAGLIFP